MKLRKLLFYIAIVQMCTAATCSSGESNDYLTNLYYQAFKSGNPLIKDPEMIYEPVVGSWLVENDRMLIVTKRDDKCLFFRFVSPSLNGTDVNYKAYINYLGTDKYVSLLAYQEQFMYFKIENDSGQNLKLQMITYNIRNTNPTGTLAGYLKTKGVDTLNIWKTVHLTHFTNEERTAYIRSKYEPQVGAFENFEKFQLKFPDYTYLAQVKENAINYTINNTYSIKKLVDYATFYPEIAGRINKVLKSKCVSTATCIEYLQCFPNDPVKDSILHVAFEKCGNYESNLEALLVAFPTDERCAGFDYKLAAATAAKKRSGTYFSYWDQRDFDARVAKIPQILPVYNTIRKMDSVNLSKSCFLSCGYGLTKNGTKQIDLLVKYVTALNTNYPNITELYFVMDADTNKLSEKAQLVFFKIAINRCINLQKILKQKLPGIAIHCIPYVETSTYYATRSSSGHFFTSAGEVSHQKSALSSSRNHFNIKKLKIDEYGAVQNTEFLPEGELVDMIIDALPEQINLYLKQQSYTRLIPANYWDESYRADQPNFDKYKEKIMNKAAEKGFDVKKLQYFVME